MNGSNFILYNDTFQDSASVCSYESSECTEVRLRDLLRSSLNIRSQLIKEKRKTPERCYFQARHSVYAGVEDLQWTGHEIGQQELRDIDIDMGGAERGVCVMNYL